MLIPVRCFTCGKVLKILKIISANWEEYLLLLKIGFSEGYYLKKSEKH